MSGRNKETVKHKCITITLQPMKSNWWPAHLYNAGGLTFCLVPFNLQYPILAGSYKTEIIVFKQQLPLDLSFSLIHLLSPLSLFLFYSLSRMPIVCELWLLPLPLGSPPLRFYIHTPSFIEESHGKGWMMYILGWLSDVEHDTAVIYHLRDTHILAPSCHTDKQMGIPAKSRGLTKCLALFYEVLVIKLLAEFTLKQLVCWVSLLSFARLGRCNSIQLEAILKYVCCML